MIIYSRRSLVALLLVVLVTGTFLFHSKTVGWKRSPLKFQLSFIQEKYKGCEQIVPNISMSQLFEQNNLSFQQAVKNASIGRRIEGFSGQVIGQYKIMHYLAGHKHVKTVCETGFNLGHSSFNYLTANNQLIVHSFDLGNHKYAHHMAKYMTREFPNRFFIHFGDSTKRIPEFIRQNRDFKCDYMYVDGGHVYPVARADIMNFAMIANLEENIIIFDDYPTNWGKRFGKAWDDMIKAGVIKEETRCTFLKRRGLQRGFTIGRVIKRPG